MSVQGWWCLFAMWMLCNVLAVLLAVKNAKPEPSEEKEDRKAMEGAHGAYEEPPRTKQLREAFAWRRRTPLEKQIDKMVGPVRKGDRRG